MFIEQIYKIEPPEGYQVQRRDILLIVIFLIHPFLLIISHYEKEIIILQFLSFWTSDIIQFIAIELLVIGTIIAFTSRLQLGKYGTTVILVEDDHQLVTSGIYKYIRHPIYLGSITLFTSIGIAVGSLFVTLVVFLCWLLMLKDRIDLEERLLTEKFGEEYSEYKKRTKKLIPFLY
jgi:protein-S-isoprenylcysteine O-methyltransferase Ste14